jgi:hypothetical protein
VSVHSLCGDGPTLAGVAHGLDDQPAGFGVKLNFFGKIRFVEQRLGNANPAGIANSDDMRFRRHGNHSVATSGDRRNRRLSTSTS